MQTHLAAALQEAATAGSPADLGRRAVCTSDQRHHPSVLGTAGASEEDRGDRHWHGCSATCRTCARPRCTDAGMWWTAIVTFTDSSVKRTGGLIPCTTSSRSSSGSAWPSQAQHEALATTSAPSASSAGSLELNLKGIATASSRRTRAALCGTCPTLSSCVTTNGGTREDYDGAILVFATLADHQRRRSLAS